MLGLAEERRSGLVQTLAQLMDGVGYVWTRGGRSIHEAADSLLQILDQLRVLRLARDKASLMFSTKLLLYGIELRWAFGSGPSGMKRSTTFRMYFS